MYFVLLVFVRTRLQLGKNFVKKRFRDLSELGMMFEFTKMALFVNLIPSRTKQT